jgi:hypothetical protein
MRTPLRCVLGFALAGLVLGACSDDDDPGTLPDVTPSTTSVESPSATPSGDPTAQLEAEITAFYEDYVDTINESWTSEEALERRRTMFADTCVACMHGYELVQRAHAEGLSLEAEFGTIDDVRLDRIYGDVVTFVVTEDVPGGRLVDADGDVVQEFGATLGAQVAFQAQRNADTNWVIIASDVLSVEGGGLG